MGYKGETWEGSRIVGSRVLTQNAKGGVCGVCLKFNELLLLLLS